MHTIEKAGIENLEDAQLEAASGGTLAGIAAATSGSLAGLWYLLTSSSSSGGERNRFASDGMPDGGRRG